VAEKLRLRCSALPPAFLCGASVRPGELVIDEANDAATMGTAAHAGHAVMVETGRVQWDAVPELAREHGVPERELRVLLALGQRVWNEIRESTPNASAEVAFSYHGDLVHEDDRFVLTGHVDVIGLSIGEATVIDWKDGRLDRDHGHQWRGYAFLALMAHPELQRVLGGIVWIREQEFEPYSMTREQALEWLDRLRSKVVHWDGKYRVGNHCTYCPRAHECEARKALVRRDVEAFTDEMTVAQVEDSNLIAAIPANDLIEGLLMADRVRLYAERYRDAIRDYVMQHGDVTGDEHALVLKHEERRGLDTRAAWPVLESMLDDEQMPDVIEVKISKVEDLVAKAAGKGKGAAAKRQLQKALDDAGAIHTTTITKLSVRRAQ
jgi:hypothetical protein